MHSPDPITRHVGRHAHCLRVNIALKLLPSDSKPAIFDAACCLTFLGVCLCCHGNRYAADCFLVRLNLTFLIHKLRNLQAAVGSASEVVNFHGQVDVKAGVIFGVKNKSDHYNRTST